MRQYPGICKKFELGLFENPYVDEGRVLEVFDTPGQRLLARQIASQSMVLLSNDGILPLKKTVGTMAVIGPNASEWRNLLGAYSYAAQLEYMLSILPKDSPLAGMDPDSVAFRRRKNTDDPGGDPRRAPDVDVLYACGCDNLDPDPSGVEKATRVALAADVVVLVLGDRSGLALNCTTGETRDSVDLRLPGVQNELAQAVFATGKPVVVVLVNGRPLAIPELAGQANAILEAWLPGEEGAAAVADVPFWECEPWW